MKRLTSFLTAMFLLVLTLQMLPNLIKTMKSSYTDLFDLNAKVGLIKIKDQIVDVGNHIKYLKKFFEQKDIKAIFIHIESPGGTAGASQAIYNEIILLKKEYPKPVVVLTNDLCASGAYLIACASDYIVASPFSIVGSIGSYVGSFKLKDFIENWKIQYNIKQSGKYKTALNPFTDTTPEIDELVQSVSDDIYKQFVSEVAASRKLSIAQANKWANGKFFTGRQAKELGLVDELGSESNAIKKLRELAMIEKDKKIEWVSPTKQSKLEIALGMEEENSISMIDMIAEKIINKLGIGKHPKAMMN